MWLFLISLYFMLCSCQLFAHCLVLRRSSQTIHSDIPPHSQCSSSDRSCPCHSPLNRINVTITECGRIQLMVACCFYPSGAGTFFYEVAAWSLLFLSFDGVTTLLCINSRECEWLVIREDVLLSLKKAQPGARPK